ncbi:hypothetical protein ARMSODRAFT_560372 [Armillaria solidipes]|uniref:Uncharacterized protein n=1 Tax=Armillaria solidipes TaxID=1076256 RepID=A0A2H3BI59_9AGAR|nr:hypothetical protein ARMSODRAFT_560372 [Armillaria solidipes]
MSVSYIPRSFTCCSGQDLDINSNINANFLPRRKDRWAAHEILAQSHGGCQLLLSGHTTRFPPQRSASDHRTMCAFSDTQNSNHTREPRARNP